MKSLIRQLYYAYGPALLSGFLLFLSFPSVGMYLLSWVSFVPILVFLYGKDKGTAFKEGLVFGVVYFFGTLYWIYHSIHYYGAMGLLPSFGFVFLLCLYLSLYPAVFSFLYSLSMKRTDLPAVFVAPVLWTSLEFLRSYALSGFPWSSIGYSQYLFLPFIQIADITGVYGISFLIVAVNGGIADLLLMERRRSERPLYSLIPTVSGLVLLSLTLVLTFVYGFYRIHQQRPGDEIKVAVVQGNIPQDQKWDGAFQQEVIGIYKDLSQKAAQEKPQLIIWPESAVPFVFNADKALTADLIDFQKTLDSYLLFGSILVREHSTEDQGKGVQRPEMRSTNSAVLLNKNGNISYIYDKIHLVPFGEYVPLRHLLFFVNRLAVGIGEYAPGESYLKAVTPFGSFGTVICYEVIFPGLTRKFFTKGGDFMVTITNDAWFGKTSGPYQHFSMAVFRAIENRKPVIRAANTGVSGYIDSTGRIVQSTKIFERAYKVMRVKTDKTLSFYTRFGDIFSYLSLISMLFILTKIKDRGGIL